jgi:hypothetical protein
MGAGRLEAVEPELGKQGGGARPGPGPPPPPPPAMRNASAALSSALSHGSSRSRWGMSTAGPHTIEPRSGPRSLHSSSSSVLLPHPLGPTTASSSPGATRSESPASARTSAPLAPR